MTTLFILLAAIGGGAALWFFAEAYQREKNNSKIQTLESKLRLSEGRVLTFRDQAARLDRQIKDLALRLEKESADKTAAAMEFHGAFKRGVLMSGACCLVFGLVFGGFVSGLWVRSSAENENRQKLMNLEIVARVAEMHTALFKEQAEAREKRIGELEQALDQEKIAKVVALTKLEIVLDNLVADKWGRGFVLNPKKLEKDLSPSEEVQNAADSARMIAPQVRPF